MLSRTARFACIVLALSLAAGCGGDDATETDPIAEHLNRAREFLEEGEHEKAIEAAGEAIRLDPKCAGAYHYRASLWMAKGDNGKAIADYTAAMRLDPKYSDALYVLGFGWFNQQEYGKAIAAYDEAIRLDPQRADARTHYHRGNALDKMGRYDEALSDYRQALRLDADFALPYFSLAQLLSSCPEAEYRDGEKAVENATEACRLTQWQDWGALNTLAAAYAEAGDFEQAVHWQTQAIETAEEDEKTAERHKRHLRYQLELYHEGKPFRQQR